MEKKQNNDRNQDKTDDRLSHTTNPDRNKKGTDLNSPVASKDKQKGNKNTNTKQKNSTSNKPKPTGKTNSRDRS